MNVFLALWLALQAGSVPQRCWWDFGEHLAREAGHAAGKALVHLVKEGMTREQVSRVLGPDWLGFGGLTTPMDYHKWCGVVVGYQTEIAQVDGEPRIVPYESGEPGTFRTETVRFESCPQPREYNKGRNSAENQYDRHRTRKTRH